MGVAFSILVTIVIAGFLWFWIVRPILEDYNLIAPRESVNDYQEAAPARARVMSRSEVQTAQTNQTDGQDGRVSEADRWLDRLEVDRTKTALIEVLVYSGWTVEQIRRLVKGENGALGTEIEAARKRLGIEPPASYVTPYVGRATSARFETDADYPYRPIEA